MLQRLAFAACFTDMALPGGGPAAGRLASSEIMFNYVRHGAGYEAVPRSAVLGIATAVALARRASAQGWSWRNSQPQP